MDAQTLNTPMIKQYLEIKEKHKDSILFYRLGDFYEMFFEDAKLASGILNIALTSRNKGKPDSVPLCGVPHHSAQGYIDELISRGFKVAICEQVEDPKTAKDVVKREVVRVITPGLITDGENLKAKENNYLLSIARSKEKWGMAYVDISTGYFGVTEADSLREISDEIARIKPKEVLLPEDIEPAFYSKISYTLKENGCACENRVDGWVYRDSEDILKRHYGIPSPESLGLGDKKAAVGAAGAAIHYAGLMQKSSLGHLAKPLFYGTGDHMVLDSSTVKNLEILEPNNDSGEQKSLLAVIDATVTPMGGRKIKEWFLFPLLSIQRILYRQRSVEELISKFEITQGLVLLFKEMHDVERLSSKISLGRANARDIRSLAVTLEAIPAIKSILEHTDTEFLRDIREKLDPMTDLCRLINSAIVDEPPISLKEGGLIREGYNPELDGYRRIKRDGKNFIASLERSEREKTKIGSLKVGYNKVFGYYIEITKANLKSAPQDYIRKQTLSNCERYVTPELKEYEEKILKAQERIEALEYEIFVQVRDAVARQALKLNENSDLLAKLDVLASFAGYAKDNNYCKPTFLDEDVIEITQGRHPVIERISSEPFIPNDVYLDSAKEQILVITGPNMAGKSTVLRQTALIAIMAQTGSYVPASGARMGIVDKIFTRVGARDRLSSGYSTFMVEMMETSNILHNATAKSLIVLDEIGRGTSTFDGVSIAWAVAEYIHDVIGAKTLFATHYHELCDLAKVADRVRNWHVTAKEWEGKLIFLRKLVKGSVNRSYGIQVAKLAGLPEEVIVRAREVLKNLESGEYDCVDMPKLAYSEKSADGKGKKDKDQLLLFREFDGFISNELSKTDLDKMTPLEALNLLVKWKKELKG